MKFKVSLNNIIIGAVILGTLIFVMTAKPVKKERSSGISSLGASTEALASREIKVTVKQFTFSPNPIQLKLNERVRFRITSEDVPHGFAIPEFGIDQVVQPGQEAVVDFLPNKKGTFTVMCSIACGPGHPTMRGSIIVE